MLARRGLLRLGLGAAAGIGLASASGFAWALPADKPRRLKFLNTHTDETLDVTYYDDGRYVRDALKAVNKLLRDHRSGEVHRIDTALLDTLAAVRRRTESSAPFEIISGYRSPKTNASMRSHSSEVAKKSLHMEGRAVDVRQRGVDLDRLYAAARGLERGGVGYYPESRFVHVDVGDVRNWRGS
jgi:uncharacterized protein YcbK (DUF882 family)